jgi:hypothetical protein
LTVIVNRREDVERCVVRDRFFPQSDASLSREPIFEGDGSGGARTFDRSAAKILTAVPTLRNRRQTLQK